MVWQPNRALYITCTAAKSNEEDFRRCTSLAIGRCISASDQSSFAGSISAAMLIPSESWAGTGAPCRAAQYLRRRRCLDVKTEFVQKIALRKRPDTRSAQSINGWSVEFFGEPDFAARCRVIARKEWFELRQDGLLKDITFLVGPHVCLALPQAPGRLNRMTSNKDNPDQNGRRSALNGRKTSSSGLRGCPWLRAACFVGLLGFSTAGVSVGSGALAANSEATGEAGSLDVAAVDVCSPSRTGSRRIGAPSLLGNSTAGGGGTTAEGAAVGAIASTL